MATGHIPLFPGGVLPDGTTNNLPADITYELLGTATPKVTRIMAAFDAAADEHLLFEFILPSDWASGGTLRGKFKMAGAQGAATDVVWKASAAGVADGSAEPTTWNTEATATVSVANDAADVVREFSIALTTTNFAANRKVTIYLGRDADNAADDATGDAELTAMTFEYTTT